MFSKRSLFKKKFNVYFIFERERERERRGGAERAKHRIQSRLQALSYQHRARRRAQTHKLRDHDLSLSWTLNQLSHPGFPWLFILNIYLFLRQRETEHEQGRSREKGRHRIRNRLQALSCQHRARRGARTHGP